MNLIGFNDTLEVYLNNKLISRKFHKTDAVKSYDCLLMLEIEGKENQVLKIVQPDQEVYGEILLDRKFKVLDITSGNKSWVFTYRNCLLNR